MQKEKGDANEIINNNLIYMVIDQVAVKGQQNVIK